MNSGPISRLIVAAILLFSHIIIAVSISNIASTPQIGIFANNSGLIERLRTEGRARLQSREYEQAADCYAAIIQKLEGIGGDEAGDLMRRCCLTLAECEIKLGNLYDAVARCSEVINETPESSDQSVQQTLGKAYYRRGVSFQRLDMPHLAYLDMVQAAKYVPDDVKVSNTIQILEVRIANTSAAVNASNESVALEDELQYTVEEAMSGFPRRKFSKVEIRRIIEGETRPSQPTFPQSPLSSLFSNPSTQDQSPLGPLQGLLSSVVEPSTLKNIMEIYSAANQVRKQVSALMRRVRENQQAILCLMTLVWIVRICLSLR